MWWLTSLACTGGGPETGDTAETTDTGTTGTTTVTTLPATNEVTLGSEVFTLAAVGGCYDAVFWAVDAAAEHMLEFNLPAATTLAAGGVYHATIDLAVPDPAWSFELKVGSSLTGNLCSGAYNTEIVPVVDEEWAATAGTLDLTLDATTTPTARLEFTDVELSFGGATGHIDRLLIEGVPFDFFPP